MCSGTCQKALISKHSLSMYLQMQVKGPVYGTGVGNHRPPRCIRPVRLFDLACEANYKWRKQLLFSVKKTTLNCGLTLVSGDYTLMKT